ncbi:MAG: hypothetical protein ACREUA_06865 [Burkholderiales bacterium]
MTHDHASKTKREEQLERKADEVFSSERREDYWAILIVMAVLVLALFFPEAIYSFFQKTLYLF